MDNKLSYLKQLETVLEAAPISLLVVDSDGLIVLCNKLAAESFRYRRREILELSVNDLVPERFRTSHLDHLKGFIDDPSSRSMGAGLELFGLRKDKTEFPLEIGLNPITSDENTYIIASIVDISDRKINQERYRLAIQDSPAGVLIASAEGVIRYVNKAVEDMFNYKKDELIDQYIEVLLPKANRKTHINYRNEFLTAPSARPMGIGRDLHGLRKGGVEFPIEIGLNPLQTSEGMEIMVIVVDIGDRRKLEEDKQEFSAKVQQTQKLESLGVLAGGIAHDFNNLLTSIVGNAELALMDLPPGMGVKKNINRILEGSHRAAELCDQMLAYSGSGKFASELFSINDIIEGTADLIQVSISKNVSIKFSLGDKLPLISGDPSQIRQIVMNLIINASEAIGDETGLVTITTGVMDYDPRNMIGVSPIDEEIALGQYVYLTVSDNGHGMDKKMQNKIFEPFFSTKFIGRGLGLAAVLGIIKSHIGTIRIYSEEGQGTTFRVLLPFDQSQQTTQQAPPKQKFNNTGMVLVMDDEPSIHQVVGDTLKMVGFDVMSAKDGKEGIELFESSMEELKLVILDLTMPYLNGDEVYRKIRQLDQDVPVIITSGYSEEEIFTQFAGRGIAGFIHKPLSPTKLLALVKETLDN